jgi:hypothetical protein
VIEIPESIRSLALTRWQARLAKDWATTDTLRADLASQGWLMKDGKEDYTLVPITNWSVVWKKVIYIGSLSGESCWLSFFYAK